LRLEKPESKIGGRECEDASGRLGSVGNLKGAHFTTKQKE
jgi:hypothetical protein